MPLGAERFPDAYARLWQELRRREWVAYAEDEPLDRAGEAVVSGLESRFGDDLAAWGAWLREELWAQGRRTTFADLEAQVRG